MTPEETVERAREDRYERLVALLRSLRKLDPAQPIEPLLRAGVRRAIRFLSAEAGAVSLRRGDGRDPLAFVATRQEIWLRIPHEAGDSRPRDGRGGTPTVSSGASAVPLFERGYSLAGFRPGVTLSSPLLSSDGVIGQLEVARSEGAGAFGPGEVELFSILADQFSVVIADALLIARLRRETLEKEILFDLGQKMALTSDVHEVLGAIIDSLKLVIGYDAAAIYLIDAATLDVADGTMRGYSPEMEDRVRLKVGEGIVGWVAKSGEPILVPDVRLDSRYVMARRDTLSEMAVPLRIGGRVIGAINLESDRVAAFLRQDLELLHAFASQAALAIERARLLAGYRERIRLSEELQFARRIQRAFLPERDPEAAGFDLSGLNISHGQVSGDYYDFITVADGHVGIVIADVAGKGVPASLIMASFRASLIAEIRNNYAIATIFRKVNTLLCESLGPTEYVTAAYGVLDIEKRVFTYTNAGHNPPILLRSGGGVALLETGGLLLGAFERAAYREGRVRLDPGDTLVLYTDGVTEARSPTGEEFGRERVESTVREARHLLAREICQILTDRVREWAGSDSLEDDLTLVVIRALEARGRGMP